MKQKTKFGRGTTLKQAMDELQENGCLEITRILPTKNGYVFEYEVKE